MHSIPAWKILNDIGEKETQRLITSGQVCNKNMEEVSMVCADVGEGIITASGGGENLHGKR